MERLPAALRSQVEAISGGFSGRFGFHARDLLHGEELDLDSSRQFPSASTIKVFVLRELFRRAEAGELDLLADRVEMAAGDRVPGSGVIRDLTPGLRLNLHDAAVLMITVSDNTASNLLIDHLGTGAINRETRRAGYTGSHLRGRFFRSRARASSLTTPADLGRFLTGVVRGTEVSREASRGMLQILYREHYNTIIGRRIPFDPEAAVRPRWRIASKSGSIRGVRNDVGYVVGPGCRYVLALMSEGCSDHRFSEDNEGTLALAEVARVVHDWFTRTR